MEDEQVGLLDAGNGKGRERERKGTSSSAAPSKKERNADEKDDTKASTGQPQSIVRPVLTFPMAPRTDRNGSQKPVDARLWSDWRPVCICVCFMLLIVVGILFLIMDTKSIFAPATHEENTVIPALAQLCVDPTGDMQTPPGAKVPRTFTLRDISSNDSHVIFFHPRLNAQVTNVIRQGSLVYTEMLDVANQRVARFPLGRSLLTSSPNVDSCWLQPLTNEQSWGSIGCQKARYIGLNPTQMRLVTDVQPSDMSDAFFALPDSCPLPTSATEDMTSLSDRLRVNRFLDVATANVSYQGAAMEDIVRLIAVDYPTSYVERPALAQRLAAAFNRWSFDFIRQFVVRALTVTEFAPRPLANDTNLCCLGDADCERILRSRPDGIGFICSTYRDCVRSEESQWFEEIGTRSFPSTTCNSVDERRCYCDYELSKSLQAPGLLMCGNCLDDEVACDCYVLSWLIQFMTRQRPCWCMGRCSRAPYRYVCGIERICNGVVSQDCEVTIHWCPRTEHFPCRMCHQQQSDDSTDVCGGGTPPQPPQP